MNPTIEDFLMAMRYLYYCKGKPILQDVTYDQLELAYRLIADTDSPLNQPGSDLERSYSKEQKALAKLFVV